MPTSERPRSERTGSARGWWLAGSFFLFALALRVLFLTASPDAAGPYSPYYEGDTAVWLDHATAIQAGQAHDLGLPLRPPGVAYLVAWLWDGDRAGLLALKLAWCLMGALVVGLFFHSVQRSFGIAVAAVAALFAAAASSLIVASSAPNNEIPYLLLVMAGMALWEPLRHRPRLAVVLAWSGLNGLACLVRAEHVLFFALLSAYLVWAWRAGAASWPRSLGRGAVAWLMFLAPLLPWHLQAWGHIERFNRDPLPENPATEQVYRHLEQALAGLAWSQDALRERDALPGFARRAMANFVATTVAMRGGREVTAADFGLLEEAFGSRPGPLSERPFVALYGGLNFRLANNEFARGGFTRAPLEVPPPLAGGRDNYPAFLVAGLPPPDLTFTYPPHVEIVNHGYRQGWAWIRDNPAAYLSLALAKLRIFWTGATPGLTGYNLPLGMAGVRRPVDMVVPVDSVTAVAWRGAGLAILLAGFWAARSRPALVPWFVLLATKTITTVAFFGYAREGAVMVPVFALALGLLVARFLPGSDGSGNGAGGGLAARRWLWAGCLAAAALVAVETYRWQSGPVVALDGVEVRTDIPAPGSRYLERQLTVR